MITERLAACSLPQILGLKVVAFRALRVIVVHALFDRMPRTFSHFVCSFCCPLGFGQSFIDRPTNILTRSVILISCRRGGTGDRGRTDTGPAWKASPSESKSEASTNFATPALLFYYEKRGFAFEWASFLFPHVAVSPPTHWGIIRGAPTSGSGVTVNSSVSQNH